MMRKPRKSSLSREPKGRRYRRCPVCGIGELVPADDIVSEIDGYTFVEQGRRCTKCGEEFIPEDESHRMIKVARRLGLWGEPLKLRRKLSRSGRGTVLRIPSDIERSLGIRGDEEVTISKVGRKIIVDIQEEARATKREIARSRKQVLAGKAISLEKPHR